MYVDPFSYQPCVINDTCVHLIDKETEAQTDKTTGSKLYSQEVQKAEFTHL